MQTQLLNRSIPSIMPNISAADQTQVRMHSLSENSSVSNTTVTSANGTQQQPDVEQPNPPYQPSDSNTMEQFDALDWWK